MLHPMKLENRFSRIQSNDSSAFNVRIQMDVVGVNVMLNHVLMNPGYSAGTNPVLG